MDQENETITEIVEKAKIAQEKIENYSQEEIDEVCLAVGWEMFKDENIAKLAKKAVEETGMGNYEDKINKHKVKVLGVINDIIGKKSVGLIEHDERKRIFKYAKPVGVVAAITPVTNPTATPASNAISILKGRNAVIFAPHPKSKESTKRASDFMREGLKKVGAPCDLVQVIENPSIELTTKLMQNVDLILATGGSAMVRAAYSSGTPAYGVGPGNSVQIIAEDADVKDAVKKITASKIFDNATSCSSENSVVIHESIFNEALEEFKKNGSCLCSTDEKKKLKKIIWVLNKKGILVLNQKIIAKSAKEISLQADISVTEDCKMIMVLGDKPIENDRFSGEKISPVLTLWKYSTIDEAIKIVEDLTNYVGLGHSCGIHTFNEQYIEKLALSMKTSRIMVRQPQAPANGGNFYNGMPSTVSLGCGTWGGNITTENINYKHFINITWVSFPFPPEKPTDEDIWGKFWKEYGR